MKTSCLTGTTSKRYRPEENRDKRIVHVKRDGTVSGDDAADVRNNAALRVIQIPTSRYILSDICLTIRLVCV